MSRALQWAMVAVALLVLAVAWMVMVGMLIDGCTMRVGWR